MQNVSPTDREMLIQIRETLAAIKVKIDNDYSALYGNGKPGLIQDVKNITERVAVLEAQEKSHKNHHGIFAAVVAFIVNAAIAIYAVLKNQ